jgi:outer membrane lipoprotein SlyB
MRRVLSALAVHLLLGVSCAAAQSNWTPTVDTYGSSRAQYLSRDMWECRELATQTSGSATGSAARGALRGGAVGAAGGAAIGAAFGNAGRGALVGGAAGGIGRGVQQASASETQFRRAFSNCLRARGHNVIN